jgi:hypothetical protein
VTLGREWARFLAAFVGGFVLVIGLLAAITLALFVTHPCGQLGVDERLTCGATRLAGIVALVSLLIGVPLLWFGRSARRPRPTS